MTATIPKKSPKCSRREGVPDVNTTAGDWTSAVAESSTASRISPDQTAKSR